LSFYRREADAVLISTRLTPRADRDSLDGTSVLADGREVVKARVRAVPEDGRANAALAALIAKALGRPKSAASIVSGATQRLKQVRVTGDAAELAAKLDGWKR
jgi:uncharacterized protein (TIGR00251 family)